MPRCECCSLSVIVWERMPSGNVRLAVRENGQTFRELELSPRSVAALVESLGGVMLQAGDLTMRTPTPE